MNLSTIGGLALAILTLTTGSADARPDVEPNLALDAEVLAELESAPAANPDRVERLRELYLQAGAAEDAIERMPVNARREGDPPLDNLIITKKGETDRVIVVGGHLDKVRPGAGIIDDWSGACLAANLYQAIRDIPTRHTFQFVGFAYEEQGLLGSKAFVQALGDEPASKVKAMINLECLGVGGPFLWTNGSTDALEALAHQVADRLDLPLLDHVIEGVGADSIPFEKVGIPNLTFDGLPLDRISLIHSDEDRYDKIDPQAYVTTYRLVTHYLLELDRAPDGPGANPDPPQDEPVPATGERP